MTFLNPIFLWASLALLIPIIIHLFNFRRPKKVLFPDISLVKEVKKYVVKRMRLRQILLLIARCLAILSLVFLFANPVWRPKGTAVQAGQASVAVVIDNSYSMQAGNDRGVYWVQAQSLTREILEAHSKNDEFLVMGTDAPKYHFDFADQPTALRDVKEVSVKQNTRAITELLESAPDIFANASYPNQKLFVIGDFQKSTFLPDSLPSLKVPEGLELHLVPLSSRRLGNAYISDHSIATQIIEPGKPVQLKLTLVNDGPDPVKDLNLRVMIGSENRPVATQDLPPFSTVIVDVALLPKSSGWQSGYIEIDDQPVDFDNKRYFSFYVPFREKMLVVEGAPAPHLKLMFGGQIIDQFEVEFKSGREFAAMNLDPYKSIVLAGLPDMPSGMQEKLTAHLQQGKSLLIFPNEGMNTQQVNAFLASSKIGTFGDMVSEPKGVEASGVDLDHPVFEGVFMKDRAKRKFDAPTLYKYFPFRPDASTIQNVVLSLPSKQPVLIESKPERGLVYTFSFFPGPSWTDFTIKSSGLAMMIQLARIMNQTQQSNRSLELGSTETRLVKTQVPDMIRMKGQDVEITPEQYVQSGYVLLKFDRQTFKEGNYSLLQGDNQLEVVSFNVADRESRLDAFDEQSLRDFVGKLGAERTTVSPGVPAAVAESIKVQNTGIPLWKYFLLAGILFLLAEFLLIRFWKSSTLA